MKILFVLIAQVYTVKANSYFLIYFVIYHFQYGDVSFIFKKRKYELHMCPPTNWHYSMAQQHITHINF